MNYVEVCFSPADYPLYRENFELVVVIDVLRATSAICTALENGVERIKPVASVTAAEEWKAKGHIGAAERNGEIVPGFDLGNSPIAYIERKEELAGKSVVLTTTNGTKAIDIASEKDTVVIGALNNLRFKKVLSGEGWTFHRYAQVFEQQHGFIPGCGILDALFVLGPKELSHRLDDLVTPPGT